MRIEKLLLAIGVTLLLASCNCGNNIFPAGASTVKSTDKDLTCKDIALEINEAEFYRNIAIERKKGQLNDVFFPYCYPSGYLGANTAQRTFESRLTYLDQIYDVLDCEAKSRFRSRENTPPPISYKDEAPIVSAPLRAAPSNR